MSWQPLVAALLLLLLATLATLQYRWLGELSEAERERMRASLRTRASELALEFDRELTRIYVAFHLDGGALERDPAGALAEALARAQGPAAAGLVRDVFLLDIQDARPGALQRFDPARRTLGPAEWPAPLEAWRKRWQDAPPLHGGPPSALFMMDAIDASAPALIVPVTRTRRFDDGGRVAVVHESAGSRRALLVWLDEERLRTQLLAPLVDKHFPAGGADGYEVAIVRRDDPVRVVHAAPAGVRIDERGAEVRAGLFELRVQELDRLAGREAPRPGGNPSHRLAITVVRRTSGDGSRAAAAGGEGQGAWELRARHRGGSLEEVVARSRRRNLVVSLGVLGLLASSVLLLIVSAQRQQRLARQQMEFVAAVSHELRTPLAVIRTAGDNLADGVVADAVQVRRYGTLIQGEGRRLGDMVERVMEFAGIGSGAAPRARGPVDVAKLIGDAILAVSADARERGVTLRVDSNGALPRVTGDAEALRSAIQNILGNAVKYSEHGGAVDVSAQLAGDALRIRVADRGLGIDAADLPHVFKPFYRGRRAVDAQVRGTGVGLSVVRSVIEAHRGTVRVESRPGEGTTVVVELPAGSGRGA